MTLINTFEAGMVSAWMMQFAHVFVRT